MILLGKLFIKGKIKALTGLHIGSSTTDTSIGDIDNSVIKTSEGIPYIPGSSLKGKIRSLLEKREKGYLCACGKNDCKICVVFGSSADKRDEKAGPTRLVVRDSYLTDETVKKMEKREGEFRSLEMNYTEAKWENMIDRLTSRADHPRQMERVPQGAEFDFQMIFNLMDESDIDLFLFFIEGLNLLEDDYLGGSGTRGYGQIEFKDLEIGVKTKAEYEGANEAEKLYTGTLKDFFKEKEEFKKNLQKKLGQ